jgi:hypothetical protein
MKVGKTDYGFSHYTFFCSLELLCRQVCENIIKERLYKGNVKIFVAADSSSQEHCAKLLQIYQS